MEPQNATTTDYNSSRSLAKAASGGGLILASSHYSSWLASCLFHVAIFVVLGLALQSTQKGFDESEGERTTGIVLVSRSDQKTEYLDEQEANSSASSAAGGASEVPEAPETPLPDLSGVLPNPGTNSTGVSENLNTGNAIGLLNSGKGTSQFGGQTASVFGVQGSGSRFVYVFDRSSSMNGFGGRPLAEAKRELIASLRSLKPTTQFQIIFYNERPTPFNPFPGRDPQLLLGTEENKKLAIEFVTQITARGSTRHLEALEFALRLSPDCVFFLTDADEPRLTDAEMRAVDRANRGASTVHAIEFGVGEKGGGENFLMRLARENSGKHVYRDVTKFGR